MNEIFPYLSQELEIFENAIRWKKYFSSFFSPYVKGDVLEVGAGIGTSAIYLINKSVDTYTCMEPDNKQAALISEKIKAGILPGNCNVINGILNGDIENKYNSIIYIDVLEHIEDDISELKKATAALKSGGSICILVPANPNDFSSFDKEIGHFRRYDKKMLQKIIPSNLEVIECKYFDICGALTSKVNKYILKQSYPNKKQILFWDRVLIPVSRIFDPLTKHKIGKSLLLVAKKK